MSLFSTVQSQKNLLDFPSLSKSIPPQIEHRNKKSIQLNRKTSGLNYSYEDKNSVITKFRKQTEKEASLLA